MLLAVDVGNTQTLVGIFTRGGKLRSHFRFPTERKATGDQLGVMLRPMLQLTEGDPAIKKAIVSSVVPALTEAYAAMFRRYFHLEALFVSANTVRDLPVDLKHPEEIGADRLVNAVSAVRKHGNEKKYLLVVDFGTAVTYDVIAPDGTYCGGAITCGLHVAAEGLFQAAAKIPKVELHAPASIVGKTTVEALQSGLVFGFAAQMEGMVERFSAELGESPLVIATGGCAEMIAPLLRIPVILDPFLTLDGLYYLSR